MQKPFIYSLTNLLLFVSVVGYAQEHRIKYSNGTDIIIGAPKSNYSWNNKTEYTNTNTNTNTTQPRVNRKIYAPPAEHKMTHEDSFVRNMSNDYYSMIANHNYLDLLKKALRDSTPIKGYTFVAGYGVWPRSYYFVDSNHDGLYAVRIESGWGYVDEDAKWKYNCPCDSALGFHNGFSFVEKDSKWGVLNRQYPGVNWEKFTVVVPMLYDDFKPLDGNLFAMKLNGKWGFVDKKGTIIIPLAYDETGSFSQGLVNVKQGGVSFYIDTSGKEVFAKHFDDANPYSESFAEVKQQGKWGMIDMQGVLVLPCTYKDAPACRLAYNKKKLAK